jgi:hypothetical protein
VCERDAFSSALVLSAWPESGLVSRVLITADRCRLGPLSRCDAGQIRRQILVSECVFHIVRLRGEDERTMKAQGFARIKLHPAPSDTDIDPRYWVFLDIELERPRGMGSNASQPQDQCRPLILTFASLCSTVKEVPEPRCKAGTGT